MKKVFAFFAAAALAASVFAAEDIPKDAYADESAEEGLGISPQLELGLGNVADKATVSVMPGIVYEHSFGNFDLFGELDYTATFDDPVAHDIYLELEPRYNLGLGKAGVLSFIVNSQNTFRLAPKLEDPDTHEGIVEPSILYTHSFDFGDLYGQAGLPYAYLTGVKDETALDIYAMFGWASTFGISFEITPTWNLSPDAGFGSLGFLIAYEKGPFYGEVEFIADKEFKSFELNPEIDFAFGDWTVWVRAEMVFADGEDAEIKPFVGASYTF